MEREEIKAKLKEILAVAFGKSPDDSLLNCDESANLVTDLGLNSVGILYVVIGMEEMFSISFDDVSFNDFQTVKDVVDYIESQVN